MKVCFACSAGGHLNQLKELFGKISVSNQFVITLKRPDSVSLLSHKKKYFISDVSRNPFSFIYNFFQSLMIFLREKPDVVITNGAGSVFSFILISRLFGKKIFFVESFARVYRPSLFGKLVHPLSSATFVQWPQLKKYYSNSIYVGPIFSLYHRKRPKKKKSVFISVGSKNNFDRLVAFIDRLAGDEELSSFNFFMQIGESALVPKNAKYVKFLNFSAIKKKFRISEFAIVHSGSGSIVNALSSGCKTIVVAREKNLNEHVDDHQSELARELSRKGFVKTVSKLDQIPPLLCSSDWVRPPPLKSTLITEINLRVDRI